MKKSKSEHAPIELKVSPGDPYVAYLRLPNHPRSGASGIVGRSIRLRDCIDQYRGPDISLDFDHTGVLIGIEVLGDNPVDDDLDVDE
jgi:hypothetical protein